VPLSGGGAKVLARFADGTAALAAGKYGKGETLFIGSFLGMANHFRADRANERLLWNIVRWSGIERPFTSSHDGSKEAPVEIRLRHTPTGSILFVINHSESDQQMTVDLKVAKTGRYRLRDLVHDQQLDLTARGRELKIGHEIKARDVQVWVIE